MEEEDVEHYHHVFLEAVDAVGGGAVAEGFVNGTAGLAGIATDVGGVPPLHEHSDSSSYSSLTSTL